MSKKKPAKSIKSASTDVEKILLGHLLDMTADPGEGDERDEVPNVGEVAQMIFNSYGGTQRIGMAHLSEFLMAEAGGMVRQRYLAELRDYTVKSSQLGYAKKPIELLTDEELEQFIEEKAKRMFRVVRDDDGTPSEAVA